MSGLQCKCISTVVAGLFQNFVDGQREVAVGICGRTANDSRVFVL